MNKEELKAIEKLKETQDSYLKDELDYAIEIVLNLIQKQEKIIDKMAQQINQAYFDKENMYIWFEEKILPKDEFGLCEYKDLGTRKTRIKEYFKKVVDEDVKN